VSDNTAARAKRFRISSCVPRGWNACGGCEASAPSPRGRADVRRPLRYVAVPGSASPFATCDRESCGALGQNRRSERTTSRTGCTEQIQMRIPDPHSPRIETLSLHGFADDPSLSARRVRQSCEERMPTRTVEASGGMLAPQANRWVLSGSGTLGGQRLLPPMRLRNGRRVPDLHSSPMPSVVQGLVQSGTAGERH
jgi:hypothetical protein